MMAHKAPRELAPFIPSVPSLHTFSPLLTWPQPLGLPLDSLNREAGFCLRTFILPVPLFATFGDFPADHFKPWFHHPVLMCLLRTHYTQDTFLFICMFTCLSCLPALTTCWLTCQQVSAPWTQTWSCSVLCLQCQASRRWLVKLSWMDN